MTDTEIMAAFRALPTHRRHEAMRLACSDALAVWEQYARNCKSVQYRDTTVGMYHDVDMGLPARAIAFVDLKLRGVVVGRHANELWKSYGEPILAMQDDDLEFPDDVEYAYYAIYNLFGLVFGMMSLDDDGEVVIRQAATSAGYIQDWWTRFCETQRS